MKTTLTTNDKEQQLSLLIDCKNGRLGKNLSADEAEQVVNHLEEQLHQAGRDAFKQWLLRFESDAETLEIDGKIYRFKMVAEKEILTKFGHITIPRRLYQQDAGGPVHVPLDAAWNMQGQFVAADVRESLLFLAAHLSPGEVVACLDKIASFSCSKTAVQNIVDEMGEILEEHEDELMETVRLAEELPVAKTKCVAVSLDGVNVRLNTPGPKKGRPTERPKDEASMSRETASCYKNAMVGDLPSRRTELPLVGTNRKMVASLPILLAVRTEQHISARKYRRSNAQRVIAPSGSSKCLDGRSLFDGTCRPILLNLLLRWNLASFLA